MTGRSPRQLLDGEQHLLLADRGVDLDVDQVGLARAAGSTRPGRVGGAGFGLVAFPRPCLWAGSSSGGTEEAPETLRTAVAPSDVLVVREHRGGLGRELAVELGRATAPRESPGNSPPGAMISRPRLDEVVAGAVEQVLGLRPALLAWHDRGARRPEHQQRRDEQGRDQPT